MTDNLHQNVEQSFPFSPVTASSKTSFPPGLSTLANSARVSELWTEELSARRQESTQSKVDAEWDAEERREDHFTPDFSIPALSAEHTSHFWQHRIYDNNINPINYCTIVMIECSSAGILCDSVFYSKCLV